jgi:pimeloyl-ACP methyl ester carboxylesterase
MMYAPKTASEERLPAVKAPSLIIMGSKDPDFKNPESEAQWIANSLHTTYTLVKDAGHYPHAEMPVTTAPLILDFMRTLNPQREAAYAQPN